MRNIAVIQNHGNILVLHGVFSRLSAAIEPRYQLVRVVEDNGLVAGIEAFEHLFERSLSKRGSGSVAGQIYRHRQRVNHSLRAGSRDRAERFHLVRVGI